MFDSPLSEDKEDEREEAPVSFEAPAEELDVRTADDDPVFSVVVVARGGEKERSETPMSTAMRIIVIIAAAAIA